MKAARAYPLMHSGLGRPGLLTLDQGDQRSKFSVDKNPEWKTSVYICIVVNDQESHLSKIKWTLDPVSEFLKL